MLYKLLELFRKVNGNTRSFWFLQMLIIIGACVEIIAMFVITYWINRLVGNNNDTIESSIYNSKLLATPVLSISIILMSSALNLFILWSSNIFSFKLGQDISVKLLKNALNKSFSCFYKTTSSEIVSKVNLESSRVSNFVLNPFLLLNTKVFISALLFSFLLYTDVLITSYIVFGFFVFYTTVFAVSKNKLANNGKIITNINTEKYELSKESLSAYIEVNLFNLKKKILLKFSYLGDVFASISAWNNIYSKFPKYLIEAFVYISLVIISGMQEFDPVKLGRTAMFAVLLFRLLPYVQQIYSSYAVIKANVDSLDVILTELDEVGRSEFERLEVGIDSIRLNKVTYRIDSKVILSDLSENFEKGYVYGVLGKSGSGKSTLLKVIMGLIAPTSGSIFYNDLPASKVLDVAYVSQNLLFFSSSIGENLIEGYTGTEEEDKKISDVFSLLGLDDVIEQTEGKYSFDMQENGSNFSGGQLQRFSIARAFLKNSDVLILDEATSALDLESQEKVMSAISKVKENKIVILSTHRVETKGFIDKIIEL